MANLIVETIQSLPAIFMAIQGQYDLTADAMRNRGQRPLVAGDDYDFQFTLLLADGVTARPITGATIRFTAKFSPSDADPGIVQKAATIVDGPNGRFDIRIDESDVVGPNQIFAFYDIQMTIGSDTETIFRGNIEWLADITGTVP